MKPWSRWVPLVFGLLASAYVLLPLFAAPDAPIDPPGSGGPPWFLKVGLALFALGALCLPAVPAGLHRTRLLRGVGLLAVYLAFTGNQAIRSSGDNIPNRYLPWAVVSRGSLDLGGVIAPEGGHLPYYVARFGDRVLSTFPLGTGLLGVPYALVGSRTMGDLPADEALGKAEKHQAALLATASVLFFFLAVRSRLGERAALATAAVLALATPVLSCASQGLWSVTGELFFVTLGLWWIFPPEASKLRLALGGVAMGGAFLCRPSALLVAAGLFVWLLAERRRAGWFAGAGALSVGAAAVFLYALYGHPLGGYASLNLHDSMWNLPGLPEGLAGNLLSPSRGLLLYLPWLLLAPAGLRSAPPPLRRVWWLSLGLVTAYLLLGGAYSKWWGGFGLGPRLQTESAPFCALLVAPLLSGFAAASLRRRAVLLGLLAVSIATQALSAYRDQVSEWNMTADPDRRPGVLWSLKNSQLAATWLRHWEVSLRPYKPVVPGLRRAGEWIAVDLSAAANTRYDRDPFQPFAKGSSPSHYPRLHPQVTGLPGWFHFLPRGRLNVVTTCQGAEPPEIPLPPVRSRRLIAVFAAGGSDRAVDGDVAATAVVGFANGGELEIPLRLGREVFEYRTPLRGNWPPKHRILAGEPADPDVLVWTVLRLHPRGRLVKSLKLAGSGQGSLGVTLFALNVEMVPSRDFARRAARPYPPAVHPRPHAPRGDERSPL